jgi:hypothetical protein
MVHRVADHRGDFLIAHTFGGTQHNLRPNCHPLAVLGLRANRVSFSLSAGSTVHGCFGRPVLMSPPD